MNPPPENAPGNPEIPIEKEQINEESLSTEEIPAELDSHGNGTSVASSSTSLQNIVSSIPVEIQDPFETVCKHFVASLQHPFRLHDHIAVHLSDKLLMYITEKKFSEWPVADKASFLTALLPRKRMNEQLRPAAEKVVKAHRIQQTYARIFVTLC
jgi:hypothetical protein